MHLDVILYVLLIDTLAIISPGPDFFMVLRNTLSHGKRAGFYTILGITLGGTIGFIVSLLGIGIIITKSPTIFTILKVSGGLYLGYIALISIFSKVNIIDGNLDDNTIHDISRKYYFKVGLLCNITNPKSWMFIIGLSTYVSQNGNVFIDGAIISTISAISVFVWFSIVSYIFGKAKIRHIFYKKQKILNICFGCILLYIASKIIFL
jgi:threonine/homoserine/homoserine lactone efflux protein